MWKAYIILFGNLNRWKLGRFKRILHDNLKLGLEEIVWDSVSWIDVALEKIRLCTR
jgi:hypothetical protein